MKKIILILLLLSPFNILAISASSSIVMDLDTGRILHANNIDEKRLIASTTKIMTCIIAIENGILDEQIVVGEEVLKAYGSAIYIEVGEILTLKDLLMGLMLRSGNDAALVIAKNIAGSNENFAMLMNEYAKKIGMNNSYFYNPHGLEESNGLGNTSTARDMALLTKYAMNNKIFREIFSTKKYVVKTNYKTYSWTNKNKLLHNYDFVTGGKTGYTKKAHRTLVTTASQNNINLVIVTLNDGNDFQDHLTLYKNIFKKYEAVKVLNKDIKIRNDTKYNNYDLYIDNDVYIPVLSKEKNNIRLDYKLYDNIKFVNGDSIGYVNIYIGNELIKTEKIYINVPASNKGKTWWQKLFGWLKW